MSTGSAKERPLGGIKGCLGWRGRDEEGPNSEVRILSQPADFSRDAWHADVVIFGSRDTMQRFLGQTGLDQNPYSAVCKLGGSYASVLPL